MCRIAQDTERSGWTTATKHRVAPEVAGKETFDTVTQALKWMRENGLVERADEASAALEEQAAYKGHQQSVAGQYGV